MKFYWIKLLDKVIKDGEDDMSINQWINMIHLFQYKPTTVISFHGVLVMITHWIYLIALRITIHIIYLFHSNFIAINFNFNFNYFTIPQSQRRHLHSNSHSKPKLILLLLIFIILILFSAVVTAVVAVHSPLFISNFSHFRMFIFTMCFWF